MRTLDAQFGSKNEKYMYVLVCRFWYVQELPMPPACLEMKWELCSYGLMHPVIYGLCKFCHLKCVCRLHLLSIVMCTYSYIYIYTVETG